VVLMGFEIFKRKKWGERGGGGGGGVIVRSYCYNVRIFISMHNHTMISRDISKLESS
jgi:hypothetical protein